MTQSNAVFEESTPRRCEQKQQQVRCYSPNKLRLAADSVPCLRFSKATAVESKLLIVVPAQCLQAGLVSGRFEAETYDRSRAFAPSTVPGRPLGMAAFHFALRPD